MARWVCLSPLPRSELGAVWCRQDASSSRQPATTAAESILPGPRRPWRTMAPCALTGRCLGEHLLQDLHRLSRFNHRADLNLGERTERVGGDQSLKLG